MKQLTIVSSARSSYIDDTLPDQQQQQPFVTALASNRYTLWPRCVSNSENTQAREYSAITHCTIGQGPLQASDSDLPT